MVVHAKFVAWVLVVVTVIVALQLPPIYEATDLYVRLHQTRAAKLEAEVKDAKQLRPAASTSRPPAIPLNRGQVSVEAVSTERSPDHRGRGKEIPLKMEGCDTSPLANVSLLIHCRNSFQVCESRKSLLELYAPFFKDVTFLFRSGCNPTGDPYLCVAQEMNKTAKEACGILYVQFDLAFSPCMLARQLDLQNLGVLSGYITRGATYRTFEHYDFNPEWFFYKGNKTKIQCRNVADDLDKLTFDFANSHGKEEKATLAEMLRHGFWHAWSDIFYIPRSAFGVFQILVPIWVKHDVFNEMALPTIFNLTSKVSGLEMKPLKCAGGTSEDISKEIILSKDFLCGHRINYRKKEHLGALQDLLEVSGTAAGVSTKWRKKGGG